MAKWPPTRGSKGHFESPGTSTFRVIWWVLLFQNSGVPLLKDLRKSYQATKNRHMPQKGWSFQQQVGVLGFLTPPTKFSQEYDQWLFQLLYYHEKRTWLFNTTLSLKIPGSQNKSWSNKNGRYHQFTPAFHVRFFPRFWCEKSCGRPCRWVKRLSKTRMRWSDWVGEDSYLDHNLFRGPP